MMCQRRFRLVVLIGLAAACLIGRADGQLALGAPALPQEYLAPRLAHVAKHITELDKQLATATEGRDLLLAQKNLWQMTSRLLQAGQVEGRRGAAATLYGLTLWHHAEQLDPLVRPALANARQALDAKDQRALQRLSAIAEAFQSFNARCEEPPQRLNHTALIDHYLNHTLEPLSAVAVAMDQPEPSDTWISRQWGGPDEKMEAALGALGDRISNSTVLSDSAGASLWKTLEMMRRGWKIPVLRWRITGLYRQVRRLVNVAETLSHVRGLDEAAMRTLTQRITDASDMIADPDRRDRAVARIAQLERHSGLMNRLAGLKDATKSVTIDPAHRLVGYIIHLEEDDWETANTLETMLDEIVAAAERYRQIKSTGLTVDILRVSRTLARQYERLETTTFGSLGLLVDDPSAAASPRWTEPVRQMVRTVHQMRMLNRIPDWVARVSALNPAAGRGLYKQLRRTAIDLVQPATATAATEALEEMHKQLALFETLPHESQLDRAGSAILKIAGGQGEPIKQQIIIQRTQWASAWGSGGDPTTTGQRLLLLRRLLQTLHEGAALANAQSPMRQLNRWAAWEVDPEYLAPMTSWLPGLLKSAASAGAAGEWETLESTLNQIDRRARVPRLMLMLYHGVGPGLGDAPGGFSGMLGQCLYPPPPGAFGADHRRELAQLCAYIEASAHARRRDDHQAADRLWDHCGELAERILKQWQTPPQRLRRAAPPATPPATPAVDV